MLGSWYSVIHFQFRICAVAIAALLLACPLLTRAQGAQLSSTRPDAKRISDLIGDADPRVREVETAAGVMSMGKLLHQANPSNDWGSVCKQSISLTERGEFRQAVRLASLALFIGETTRNAWAMANAARDLAFAYGLAGDHERSIEWANTALKYVGSSFIGDKSSVVVPVYKRRGDAQVQLGNIDAALKDYDEALSSAFRQDRPDIWVSIANAELKRRDFDKAREYFAKAADTDVPRLKRQVLRGQAELALAQGKNEDARELFDAAQKGAESQADRYNRMWALHGLGRARLALGDRDGAIEAYSRAMMTAEQLRTILRSQDFRAGFFGDVQIIFDEAISILVDAGRATEALAISERSRARALLDLLRGEAGPGENIADADTLKAALPANTVVAIYHVLADRTVTWTVRQSGVTSATTSIGREPLRRMVQQYRSAIVNRRETADALATRLYEVLIAPLKLQAGEAVVFVPHKSMHFLPLQALRGPAGYLIEERAVAIALSASSLISSLVSPAKTHEAFLALGNPSLDSSELALPGAEREVQSIGKLYPAAQIFVQRDATRERFLSISPQSGIVHVAAHATVDEIDPLYSTIKLASVSGGNGDVEAHDIFKLKLGQTRLLTLSACSSGLGTVSQGDDFWGFQRAFLSAGTHSLLVSLWPVADESTAVLMQRFYEQLKQKPAIEALRDAQLALIKDKEWAEPLFWAPFVLVGDWR